MIEKLDVNDGRPLMAIHKINELIDEVNKLAEELQLGTNTPSSLRDDKDE